MKNFILKALAFFVATNLHCAHITQDLQTGAFVPSPNQTEHLEILYENPQSFSVKYIPLSIAPKKGKSEYCTPASVLCALKGGKEIVKGNEVTCFQADFNLISALFPDDKAIIPEITNQVLDQLVKSWPDLFESITEDLEERLGKKPTSHHQLCLYLFAISQDKQLMQEIKVHYPELAQILENIQTIKIFDQTVFPTKTGLNKSIIFCSTTGVGWYNPNAGINADQTVLEHRQYNLKAMLTKEELFEIDPDGQMIAKPLNFSIIITMPFDCQSPETSESHTVLVEVATSNFRGEKSVGSIENFLEIKIYDTVVSHSPSTNNLPIVDQRTVFATDAIVHEVLIFLRNIQYLRSVAVSGSCQPFQSSSSKSKTIKTQAWVIAERIKSKLSNLFTPAKNSESLPSLIRPSSGQSRGKKTEAKPTELPTIR